MGQRVKFRSLDVAHEVAFLDLPNPGLRGHPTSHAGKQKRDGRKEGGWNAEAVTISRVRGGAAPNPFRTSGGGGGSAYGKGRKKTSLEPRQHLTATAKEGGRLEPGKRGGPKRTPGRGPGAQILGHGFLWKPGTPSFCSVLGPSRPRGLPLSPYHPSCLLPSLPPQGLPPGSDSYPGGRGRTALQGHLPPSPNGAAPGPQDRKAGTMSFSCCILSRGALVMLTAHQTRQRG